MAKQATRGSCDVSCVFHSEPSAATSKSVADTVAIIGFDGVAWADSFAMDYGFAMICNWMPTDANRQRITPEQ